MATVLGRNLDLGIQLVAVPGPTVERCSEQQPTEHFPSTKVPTTADETGIPNAPEVALVMSLSSSGKRARQHIQTDRENLKATYSNPSHKGVMASLDLSGQILEDWDRAPEETDRLLLQILDALPPTNRDQALVGAYVFGRLAASREGEIQIGFTELLDLEGKKKATPAERERLARGYNDIFTLWSRWRITSAREWHGKRIEIDEPLLIYQSTFYRHGQRPLNGMFAVPEGFAFVDSTLTKRCREDPTLMCSIGIMRQLAQIPAGKPSGDWAKSMGLTSVQLIRNNAKNGGATMRLSRRKLLTTHVPNTSVEDIMNGDNPGHIREYWDKAVEILTGDGTGPAIWARVEQPTDSLPRKGWVDQWLDQVVTVTLSPMFATAPTHVLASVSKGLPSAEAQVHSKAIGESENFRNESENFRNESENFRNESENFRNPGSKHPPKWLKELKRIKQCVPVPLPLQPASPVRHMETETNMTLEPIPGTACKATLFTLEQVADMVVAEADYRHRCVAEGVRLDP